MLLQLCCLTLLPDFAAQEVPPSRFASRSAFQADGPGTWEDLVAGTWALGAGTLGPGTRDLWPGTWELEAGSWYPGIGTWDLGPGIYLGPGIWDLGPKT